MRPIRNSLWIVLFALILTAWAAAQTGNWPAWIWFADSGQSLGDDEALGVALGDVDGDRDIDVVLANGIGPGRVWLNDGSGGFTATGQGFGHSTGHGVALGDLDGDGDLDAVLGYIRGYGGNRVSFNVTSIRSRVRHFR